MKNLKGAAIYAAPFFCLNILAKITIHETNRQRTPFTKQDACLVVKVIS